MNSKTFTGLICKDCKKPFWIFNQNTSRSQTDTTRIRMYLDQGHIQSDNISAEIVKDLGNWCSCSLEKELDIEVETEN